MELQVSKGPDVVDRAVLQLIGQVPQLRALVAALRGSDFAAAAPRGSWGGYVAPMEQLQTTQPQPQDNMELADPRGGIH